MRAIKKGMILGLSIAMVLSFTACGEQKEKVDNQTNTEMEEKDVAKDAEKDGDDNIANNKENSENADVKKEAVEEMMYFGKVKGVIGNEVEVDLAKNEAFDQAMEGTNDEASDDESSSGDMSASVTVTAAVSVEAGTPGPEGKPDKMELEYTGESQSFVIPAGIQILGLTGTEVSMSDIKEGSVLFVTAKGSKEAPEITSIQIVE